jgi:hypothetical protein
LPEQAPGHDSTAADEPEMGQSKGQQEAALAPTGQRSMACLAHAVAALAMRRDGGAARKGYLPSCAHFCWSLSASADK